MLGVDEIVSLEFNQVEIINILDSINNNIEDFKSVIVIVFGFIVGYLVMKDFMNNIFKY